MKRHNTAWAFPTPFVTVRHHLSYRLMYYLWTPCLCACFHTLLQNYYTRLTAHSEVTVRESLIDQSWRRVHHHLGTWTSAEVQRVPAGNRHKALCQLCRKNKTDPIHAHECLRNYVRLYARKVWAYATSLEHVYFWRKEPWIFSSTDIFWSSYPTVRAVFRVITLMTTAPSNKFKYGCRLGSLAMRGVAKSKT